MITRAVSAASTVTEAVLAAAVGALPHRPPELAQGRVLGETANRPWPVPDRPWLMAQTWRDLLFAHWPLPPASLEHILPRGLELDTFDGSAWIGVTPFELSGLRPRGGVPLPGASRFPELNVRTYVTLGRKPGIFFLSLDAASGLAVLAARRAYRLPYFRAKMSVARSAAMIRYVSRRVSQDGEPAEFEAEYHPSGPVVHAAPGSLEYFLTERYCLYTLDDDGQPLRGEIQHPPWPLQSASAALRRNSMTRPWGIELPDGEPLLHYARVQNVLIWTLSPAT